MTHSKKASSILALGQKTFFLRPICLDRYLRQLDLTESAREVFWYHWGMGYRERTVTTQLSIDQVVHYLKISPSSVCRAYEQLSAAKLIVRSVEKAEHGGFGVAKTTIDLPDTVLAVLMAENPDRQRIGAASEQITPTHADPRQPTLSTVVDEAGSAEHCPDASDATEKGSTDDLAAHIDALSQQIQQQNVKAMQCSKHQDIEGYRRAVTQAEQAQRRRDALRTRLDSKNAQIDSAPERGEGKHPDDPDPTPAAAESVLLAKPAGDDVGPKPKARQLSAKLRDKIAQRVQAIQRVSNPLAVTQEIIFSIERGTQSKKPIPWAINAALALLEANRWRTPYGFHGVLPLWEEGYAQIEHQGTANLR
ncbi:MAG: hypothetical protein KDK04_29985 [Candidatus Competibacteraceae bacterium]|nr:hypothetical protein [Candidatus Competibacteraceae bacterium]MCB1815920.1 hypothetical protein [Candidatus Competibacteraceae bacterium]